MRTAVKDFEELTVDELYAILRLRSEVFVVEQSSVYLDIDGADKVAIHVWMEDEEGIEAYARVLPAGTTFDTPAVGRIIARKRGMGLGTEIMNLAMGLAEERFGAGAIKIEAQVQAVPFYERFGFEQASGIFDDGGIDHIVMIRRRNRRVSRGARLPSIEHESASVILFNDARIGAPHAGFRQRPLSTHAV